MCLADVRGEKVGVRQNRSDAHIAKGTKQSTRLSDGICLGAGAFEIARVYPIQGHPWSKPEEPVSDPEHEADETPLVIDHYAGFSIGFEHAVYFGNASL